MNKKTLILGYSIIVFFVSILRVPLRAYGPDHTLRVATYAPIWILKSGVTINNARLYYELDLPRLIITLIAITIITLAIYVTSFASHKNSFIHSSRN